MQFSIAEAAKLYGKQRKTLYRHMEAGRLSYHVLGSGRRALDLAELIRVYGEPPGQRHGNDTLPVEQVTRESEALVWRAMLEELQALRREVAELRQQFALPAPPSREEPPRREDPPRGHDRQTGAAVRSMSDVLARFSARSTKAGERE